VRIDNARGGATTDNTGQFRLTVPAGPHTVTVLRLGYASARRPVTVAAGEEVRVDVSLQTSAVSLEQVVVTGTAGAQELRTVGNAVSTIRAADELAKSAAPDMGALLRARTTGLDVLPVTGRVGAGPAIQIRGPASIGLSNNPLIYVDGVRVNNAVAQGPASAGGLGTQGAAVMNRLNDFNPEDIERIEIIKGPAAATIYGTEAANGVVQIFTKRGVSGSASRPEVTISVQNGSAFFRDVESRVPTNFMRDAATNTIVEWNGVKQEADSGRPIFNTGWERRYNGSVSGAREQVRYYASAGYINDLGLEPNNSSRQFTTHGNLSTNLGAKTELSTSLNFVNLSTHVGADVGASALLGAIAGHRLLFPASRGFYPNFPPEVPQQLYDNASRVNQFTGSGTLSNQPLSWLNHRLIAGLDYVGEDTRAIEHVAPPELVRFLSAAQAGGRIGQTLRRNSLITLDYSATGNATLTSDFTSATSVGGQFNRTEFNSSFLGGFGFPARGVETVSAAANALASTQADTVNTTIGAYVQEQVGWRDRVFLTGAVRVDNNSAFGEDFKWITYPKFGLSWVVSDEPFWTWDRWVNTLRFRTAYGESGRQPRAFSALRTFTPVVGPGGTNAVTPSSLGNPELKPERGKEIEVGFEAQVLNRVGLEFTHYSKKTLDEIVSQPVAPSSGFSGSQLINIGRVDSRGIEARVTYDQTLWRDIDWSLMVNVSTATNTIKENIASAVSAPGTANIIGYPIQGLWSKRVVSADRDATTGNVVVASILCEGPDGSAPVACATAPFKFMGPSTPKTFGAVANTFNIGKSVRLFGLVDFRRGHRIWNQNELIRCNGLAGAPLCRANYFPQEFSTVQLANYAANAFANSAISQTFQDASFVKLREISATYFIPPRFAPGMSRASITLAARELHTWTGYGGIDPEGVTTNATIGTSGIDQAVTPPLTRFIATLNLTW
jgi:TonB-linked SusC/RagA family outer membrane protein